MSEIKVDTLTGKTSAGDITVTSEGGAATMQLQQGLLKMWAAVTDSGTASATDSLNSSSITDVTTGKYDVNLSNAMSDTNQGCLGVADDGAANPQRGISAHQTSTTKYGVGLFYSAFNTYDNGNFTCAAVGDLA